MLKKIKAKCPHCHALLNIERPHESRVAPCPCCNGDIRIPQDIVPKPVAAGSRPAAQISPEVVDPPSATQHASSRNVVRIVGGIAGVLAILYLLIIRGRGSEATEAMEKAHEISTLEKEAQRELDIEELQTRKARLVNEIESLGNKINRTDAAIRALLNQPDLSTSDIESAFEGEK
jgi:hypothetical protein